MRMAISGKTVVRGLSQGVVVASGVLLVLLALPLFGLPQNWLLYFFLFFLYLAMANMWNLLAGYCGLISLCQAAFIGLAGYTMIILTWVGVPYLVGIIAGTLAAGAFALFISVPVFRLRGTYFAIGTLVVPEALRIIFLLWRPVGGELQGGGAGYVAKGASGVSTADLYWLALALAVASMITVHVVLHSRLGLGLAAIRDNDLSAATSGVDVFRLKMTAFFISALVTGLAGCVLYIYQGNIEPTGAFNIKWTMMLILATVIGGMRTQEGPILGTVFVVFLYFLLSSYPGISLLIQGIILVFVMLVAPNGIVGLLRRTRAYYFLGRFFRLRPSNS